MSINLKSYIENIPVAVRQQKLRRQTDVKSEKVNPSVSRNISKRFANEGGVIIDVLEPFTIKDNGLSEVGRWSHDHYSSMLIDFLQDTKIPDKVPTIIVAKKNDQELLEKLHEKSIKYVDDANGLSLPEFGLNLILANDQSGWENDRTMAHEELHSVSGFAVASDLWGDEYGFKDGFISFSAESGIERGRAIEEGMAATMAFEVLMSRRYQEGRRANYASMLHDIGRGDSRDLKPLQYSRDYMDWLDNYLEYSYPSVTTSNKYYWSGKIVGELLTKAKEMPGFSVAKLRNMMMATRVDGKHTRQMMEMVDKIAKRPGFTRDWFQVQFDKSGVEKMKKLVVELV